MNLLELAHQDMVNWGQSISQRLVQLSPLQAAGLVAGMAALLALAAVVIVWQRAIIGRSMRDLGLLVMELEKVTAELNVERVWRLAGDDAAELPEETLKKLYRHVGGNRLAG